jgi:hypothetical protein
MGRHFRAKHGLPLIEPDRRRNGRIDGYLPMHVRR